MKFTIQLIPAYREPLPEFVPRWVRLILCWIRGHRLVSNLPAMASGMVPYMQKLYDSGDVAMPPSSCIDCGHVEKC
jgi:hypothetical protein